MSLCYCINKHLLVRGAFVIYLDYSASFPPFPEVIEKMGHTAREYRANPAAIHAEGARARALLRESRKLLADVLNVRPEEIYFTSGGTEANNWAVKMGALQKGKRHIVCFASEHKSVLEPVETMGRQGFEISYVNPGRDGRLCPDTLKAAIRPDTALVCVQAVNNETGVIQDVEAIARLCAQKGAVYHCDGVQALGHVELPLNKAGLISLSAHKLGGPRGAGCLIIGRQYSLSPFIEGGGQEFSLRSGTENLPGIAGFALAAELSVCDLPKEYERLKKLRDMFEKGLYDICPGTVIAGEKAERSPGISCCALPGITAEELVMRLDLKGICASPGAACSARETKPSHVLVSMGYDRQKAGEFVRFSMGRGTTEEEIRQTLSAVAEIWKGAGRK